MLKLRVRHVTDSGAKGRIIQTARGTIEVTDKENGAASLSFSVLDSVADGLREPLFRVSVEYAVGAGEYQPLTRNNVFLVKQLDGDDASQNNLITYTGESYVFAMLSKHWVIVNERTKDGKRSYHDSAGNPVSAGWIAREELDESKAAGWAPDITQSYTATHDSNGVAWTSDDKMKFDISVPTQQHNLIDALINQGMCEVETVGMDFRLLRPGTTRNKTNVVLGGTGIKTIPVKVDGSEKYTRIWVHMDDEAKTTFMHNVPNADMRFGSMDMMLTLSGVSDRATANKLAAAAAAEAGALKTEIAYEWTPDTEETYIPWRDFHVGDTVISKTKSGKQERRVIGLVARESGDATSVRAIVGERIASRDTKLLKKLGSVSVGGTIGGTGNSFPAQPPKPFTAPIAPAGLVLTANTASWAVTGEAITSVTFSWQAVSYGVDDSMVDIAEYEIWSRYPSGTRQRDIAVTGANTTATVESWVPGVQRLVSVRAKSTKNVWSEFSDELAVTPLEPKSLVPPAPAQPTIVSNIGGWGTTGAIATITLDWPSITQSIDGEPINVTAYEVWNEELIVATVTESTAALTLPSGTTTQLRVRAISDNNLVSDLSEFVSVTAATPSVVTRAPSTPTLTTGQGTVVVRWDGTYVSGGTAGARSVTVERSTGSSWVVEGSAMTQAGTVSISGQPGTTVTVRLQAYDQLGRLTGTSSSASITVAGVSLTDLDAAVSDFLNDVDVRVDAAQLAAESAQEDADQAIADALAAANAASDAQDTADAKGKVIIQSSAPAVADRLAQNLWIDTTNNANTPKRWSGSAWVVVTDKAATDAAAAAVAAQNTANTAVTNAAAAATAAGLAQTTADTKNKVWYTNTMPPGTGHKKDDIWFDGANNNRLNLWNGTDAWVPALYGTNAISDTAINAAKLASNAVTEAKILNGAITNDKLNSAVQNAITTAQSTATNAQTAANAAQTAASTAQGLANAAQADADQAIADALAAANAASGAQSTANAKGKVIIQSTAPDAADRLVQNLWIDTTDGANTPKRWTTGTTWVAVTDKVATDAAAAAATAQSVANAAQTSANSATTIANAAQDAADAAATAAANAQSSANAAQTTANGKNKIIRSTSNASGTTGYTAGDQWWKYSGTEIVGMWIYSGSAWVAQTLTDAVITNLDAGTITAGTINTNRFGANTITGTHISGATVTAANMVAGTITAASGIIADAAIGSAKIIDGAITTAKIGDAQITNAKIGNVDAGKITTGTLNAGRIGANSIEASKLLLSGANLIPGADLRVLTGWVSANITPTLNTATRGRSLLLARNTTDLERSVTSAEFGVTAGATYTVSATVLSQTSGAGLRIEIVPVNSSGVDQTPIIIASATSDNNWKTIRGQWTPAASTYRGAKFRFVGNATTATTGSDYLVQPRMVEAAVAEMIVDGAITADKVTFDQGFANAFWANEGNFGKISTNFIEPSFGENLNLQANGYIEFIAGRQTDQALALSAVEDLAETANSQVQVVSDNVGTAIALADSAQQTADSAAAAADTVTNRLTEHQAVFRVTPSGAVVGTQDSSQELRLNPGSVELVQNGIPISTWESGKFIVDKIDVDVQAEIGSHSFEAYGAGRTIIRPI